MDLNRAAKRGTIPEAYSLEKMATRLAQEISHIEYQRARVREEPGSAVRSKTLAMYDEMLAVRLELMDKIQSERQRRSVA